MSNLPPPLTSRPADTEDFKGSIPGINSTTANDTAPVHVTRQSLTRSVSLESAASFGTALGVTPVSLLENKAVNVRPPRKGEVYRFALTTGTVVYGLPSAWTTKYITIKAVGGNLQYQCGGSADTLSLTYNAVASGTSSPTVNNASGKTLKDGDEDSFRIYNETKLAVISDATDGYVEFYLSNQPDSQ